MAVCLTDVCSWGRSCLLSRGSCLRAEDDAVDDRRGDAGDDRSGNMKLTVSQIRYVVVDMTIRR